MFVQSSEDILISEVEGPGNLAQDRTDRAVRGWVRHMFGRRSGMLGVLSLIPIYSLGIPHATSI